MGKRGPKVIQYTPEQIEDIEEMAGRGLSVTEIAHNIGVGHATLERRLVDTEEIDLAWRTGKARAKRFVTNKLFELIEAKNPAAIFFFLKTQCGWKETSVNEISGKDGKPLEIETKYSDIDALMRERFKQILNKEAFNDDRNESEQ